MGLSVARLKQGSLCLFFVGRKQIEPNKTIATDVLIDTSCRNKMPGGDSCPFEPKASDWEWFEGRMVALDHSTPAWGGRRTYFRLRPLNELCRSSPSDVMSRP